MIEFLFTYEALQHTLADVGLAPVHVLDQRLEVLEVDVLQHDHRGLILEVAGAKEILRRIRNTVV